MKINIFSLGVLLLLIQGCTHQAHEHKKSHHHGHADHKSSMGQADQRLKLNKGKKWQPDEVMLLNMDIMHTGLVELKKKEHHNEISQKDYASFYNLVSDRTEEIITNCEMTPEMDDVYHVILERMLEANEDLKSSKTQKAAVREFISAFMDYQKYFDHSLKH